MHNARCAGLVLMLGVLLLPAADLSGQHRREHDPRLPAPSGMRLDLGVPGAPSR